MPLSALGVIKIRKGGGGGEGQVNVVSNIPCIQGGMGVRISSFSVFKIEELNVHEMWRRALYLHSRE